MSNVLAKFEQEQMEILAENKKYPEFKVGDQVCVRVKIGDRFQNYEGVCIAIKNRGLNSSFTVRKLSYGEGVERVFPYYSPNVDSVRLLKRGKVRRAKLYYLKGRVGKAAKIAEDTSGIKAKLAKEEAIEMKKEKEQAKLELARKKEASRIAKEADIKAKEEAKKAEVEVKKASASEAPLEETKKEENKS